MSKTANNFIGFTTKPVSSITSLTAVSFGDCPISAHPAGNDHLPSPSQFVAMTIIIAHVVMVGTSLIAMRLAEKRGYWRVLLISFISLPIRGFIAAQLINHTGLYPVQILDGIGAGLQSAAVPGLVAHILNGTGRINIGQGAVITMQGLGASLSPAIGGWIAEGIGYSSTFLLLGSFAFLSIFLWVFFYSTLKDACDPAYTANSSIKKVSNVSI